jgi:hypothetical protein
MAKYSEMIIKLALACVLSQGAEKGDVAVETKARG